MKYDILCRGNMFILSNKLIPIKINIDSQYNRNRKKNQLELKFEWDENKDQANQRKHGISFEEAKTIFQDPFSITINDPIHSIDEERFIDIGLSNKLRLLVVVYTETDSVIRLISSRKATSNEQKTYEQS